MSPPRTATCATPPVERSLGRMVQSAMVLRSSMDVESAVMPTMRSSPRMEDCGPRVGLPTLSGSSSAAIAIFSDTICLARYMSMSQSNSTHTTENPVVEDERTLRTPVAPFTAVSIGKVTSCSTSSAAIPPASVITTTVGAFRSGKTSTSVRFITYTPATMSRAAATSISSLLFRENCIILFSIVLFRIVRPCRHCH